MTSISFDRVGAARAPFVWPANAASRVSLGATAIMLALLAPTLIAFAFDDRQVNGVDVWMKPIHFQLAIALHGLTIAALAPLLRADALNSALLRRFVTASAVASVFEIGYIMEQAARGRGSHFNFATPLETALYGVMGAGAGAVLWVGTVLALRADILISALLAMLRTLAPHDGLDDAAYALVVSAIDGGTGRILWYRTAADAGEGR